MRLVTTHLIAALAVVAAVTLAGCACGGPSVEIIDMQTDALTIPTGSAQDAVIVLDLGIGTLTVEGGSPALCTGKLQYNVAEWKPVVEHSVEDGQALVRITQPNLGHRTIRDDARANWTLSISDDVPTQIAIDMGVGKSHIDLGDAMVERLDVEVGVCELTIDAGSVRHDLTMDIDSGVGAVTIHVPDDIGVHVECDRGVGSFHHVGLTQAHGGYVNAAYGESESLITIHVDSGVGGVTVVSGTMTASI